MKAKKADNTLGFSRRMPIVHPSYGHGSTWAYCESSGSVFASATDGNNGDAAAVPLASTMLIEWRFTSPIGVPTGSRVTDRW